MTKKMNIYFVLPSEYEDEQLTSQEMQQAFELCRQNQIIPEWISEKNCLSTNFNKSDIVVFEKFEGETFQQVQTRLSVVGPWCIITCLLEGLQVPNNRSPILNLAMYNLSITASNYTPEQKKKMKDKVEMMGGSFNLHVTSHVTHLITNSVRTQKYAVANAKSISVMLDSWIEDVWNASLTRRVKATDEEFMKHKCPCFQNLRITTTGFDFSERQKLQKLINENGGLYSGKLSTTCSDILVCKLGTNSDKITVARRAKLPCVRVEWIYDSVEKGFVVSEEEYLIKFASSTPTKGLIPPNPDFSIMSAISGQDNIESYRTSASETLNPSLYSITPKQTNTHKENQEPDVINEIDLQTVRLAGPFLDGCGVLLAGFTPERREKLCRILRCAGATRYDTLSDRVTQVIVGDLNAPEVRSLESTAPLVTTAWLKESLCKKQPASEEPFIIRIGVQNFVSAPTSPLSKKGLTLLHQNTSITVPPAFKQPEAEEHESVKLYKNSKINNEQDTLAQLLAQGNVNNKFDSKNIQKVNETEVTGDDETWDLIFEGKTFKILENSENDYEKLSNFVEELGGKVVMKFFSGVTDYVVTPITTGAIRNASTEIINSLWLLDCYERNELLIPEYYHQPLIIAPNVEPLKDCVITVSGYTGSERKFLIHIIQKLGAVFQDKFARIANEDSNVLRSTHLVCLEPIGSKWMAAQRWERYVVTHEWLLKCAEMGKCIPEHDYTLTDGSKGNAESIAMNSRENKNKSPIKRDFERLKTSPLMSNANDDGKKERTLLSSNNKKDSVSLNENNKILSTSTKRNFEGKRKLSFSSAEKNSSLSPIDKQKNDEERMSPILNNTPVSSNVNKPFTYNPINDTENEEKRKTFLSNTSKPFEYPIIDLEDGRKVPLNIFMEELRSQGLFDTPSPMNVQPGTPIPEFLARLRRENKIPCLSGDSPVREATRLGSSQGTPVEKYLRGLKERNILPTSPKQTSIAADSPIPRPFFDVKTPETPLGRFLGDENPSRSTRKHWQRYIDRFPHYSIHDRPAPPPRRPSTPLSEVKRQVWDWLLRDKDNDDSTISSVEVKNTVAVETKDAAPEIITESQNEVSNQIGQIQDMLKRRESSGPNRSLLLTINGHGISTSSENAAEAKDSQPGTVDWDESLEDCVFSESMNTAIGPKKFMMSVVEQSERESCCNIIRSLGGEVSDLKNFDPTATHVICSNPARNEKILSSVAAGLWVLHASYIEQSGAAGRFLSEELFEIGNPKSAENIGALIESSPFIEAVYWWKQKVKETGHGAFHGIRAILSVKNFQAVVRLIEAGGGQIVEASPPFNHSIDATHCFLDSKKQDLQEFIPLAEQGIPCLNVVYLSNYLSSKANVNIDEFIMPSLREFYK